MASLIATVWPMDDVVELVLAGDLTDEAVTKLVRAWEELNANHVTLLVMDLSGVTFISGSAVSALDEIYLSASIRGVEISVIGLRREIRLVLTICRSPLLASIDD